MSTTPVSKPAPLVSQAFRKMLQNQLDPIFGQNNLYAWHTTNNDIFTRMLKELSDEESEDPAFPQSTRELSNFESILTDTALECGWIYTKISKTQVELRKIGQSEDVPDALPAPPTEPIQPLLPQRGPSGLPYMTYEYGLSKNGVPVFRFLPYNSVPIPSEDWFRFMDVLDAMFDVPKLQRSGTLRIVPRHIFKVESWDGAHERIASALKLFNRDPWPIQKDGLQGPGV